LQFIVHNIAFLSVQVVEKEQGGSREFLPTEARRANSAGGVVGERAAGTFPTSNGVKGNSVSSGTGGPLNDFFVF